MFSDKIFITAFLISTTVHGVILLEKPNLIPSLKPMAQELVKVSYIKEPKDTLKAAPVKIKREAFLKITPKITFQRAAPVFINKEVADKISGLIPQGMGITKPALVKPDIISVKKKITLSLPDMTKINNSAYISHAQIVREKIKRSLYQNYSGTETGEVFLTFVVSNDGYLRDVRIAEEKSVNNQFLKEIALRSIKDASPFPSFPKDLDYPQLSFNVGISFEIE